MNADIKSDTISRHLREVRKVLEERCNGQIDAIQYEREIKRLNEVLCPTIQLSLNIK